MIRVFAARERLDEVRGAVQLLSRFPVWRQRGPAAPEPVHAVWAFPIAGGFVGAAAAAAYLLLAGWGGVPAALAAVVALVVQVLATGAFHEDGLADTADGLGGGRTRERKLEIMRDSRIGTYGTVALVLLLAWRATAIAAVADPWTVAGALIGCGALSRAAILVVLARGRPARADGLGSLLAAPDDRAVAAGLAIAFVVGSATLPGAAILLLPLVAAAVAVATTLVAKRQLGGYTGDILGATQQFAEAAMLLCLVLVLA